MQVYFLPKLTPPTRAIAKISVTCAYGPRRDALGAMNSYSRRRISVRNAFREFCMSRTKWIPAVLLGAVSGCERVDIEHTFHDCVLNRVSAMADVETLEIVRKVCANKYQVAMPKPAVARLTGQARFSNFENLGRALATGRLENRNKDWIVTQLELHVVSPTVAQGQPYRLSTFIEPLSQVPFDLDLPPAGHVGDSRSDDAFSWRVVAAWGIPVAP